MGALYLYCNCLGNDGSTHRKEIEEFAVFTDADGIRFHSLSDQELILKRRPLMNNIRKAVTEASGDYHGEATSIVNRWDWGPDTIEIEPKKGSEKKK